MQHCLLLFLAGLSSGQAAGGRQQGEGGLEDRCRVLLEGFSQSSSNFTRCGLEMGGRKVLGARAIWYSEVCRCANQYATPIFMCRKCVQVSLTNQRIKH